MTRPTRIKPIMQMIFVMANTNSVSANIRTAGKEYINENRDEENFTDVVSPNMLMKMLHIMRMDV